MRRLALSNYRGLILAPDVAEVLRALTARVDPLGWRLKLTGPTPVAEADPLSLIPAGREIHLVLERDGTHTKEAALNALWGHAVPLGFTPAQRFPVTGRPDSQVFHFYGPWQALVDRLLAEGRGHLAWPSLCCAAQADAGCWKGDHPLERFVQAQLHRLGFNCGPIDGQIGMQTADALTMAGHGQNSLDKIAEILAAEISAMARLSSQGQQVGHLAVPGRQIVLQAHGGVQVIRTQQGATLFLTGEPGRLVVDIQGAS